jgi:putative transposase
MENIQKDSRNSTMDLGRIYFWTATINKWQRLLTHDSYKQIITDSLDHLTIQGKIDVFAFVIMPNHIHLIWKLNSLNGKESPHASFLKFTAHEFKKKLKIEDAKQLECFSVEANNKQFEFWQRDSLAINLYSREMALQKLNYIHSNPLSKHWTLANEPSEYWYSSARFYERNEKHFPFLKWIWDDI